MRVLHVITSLARGGAETMLRNVVLGLDRSHYTAAVLSLIGKEPIGSELEGHGIPVTALGGRGSMLLPQQLSRAQKLVRDWQPDLIHGWMYHANVVAHLLRPAAPGTHLITSIRGALDAPTSQKYSLRIVRWVDARSSHRADIVLFNSRASAQQHAAIGYEATRMRVIPNGFDTERFAPRCEARTRIRSELGVGDRVLIGMVARFDELKGHEYFLRAASALGVPDCRYLLAGRGCDGTNRRLARWLEELGLSDRVYLLGERADVSDINNALDVAVSASISESFPNAIGEAMACATPCIVTDVGDCAVLLGNQAGRVVPPRDVSALAAAMDHLVKIGPEGRQALGALGRARIEDEFSIAAIVRRYQALYDEVTASSTDNAGSSIRPVDSQ